MKNRILAIIFFGCTSAFAQTTAEPVIDTPDLEQRIRKLTEIRAAYLREFLKDKKESAAIIEFAIDTFRVVELERSYLRYDYTTSGMRTAVSTATHQYDSLMNKYYKKLLAALKPADKATLVQAQKAWLAFRDNELKLIQTMSKDEYSGGGTIHQLIVNSEYQELVRQRLEQIFSHLQRVTWK